MKEINTENWQEFQIGKLFQVSRGRRFVVSKHKEGNIPYYSASLENNGVTDYISNPLFIDRNAIIVTTFCDAFYAKGEFTASDEITILHHEKMNEMNGLFIASAISKNAWKYSFKVKAFQTRITEDTIKLPINKKGEPDWEYMDSYMKNIVQESEKKIKTLQNIDKQKHKIKINNWQDFSLGGESGLFNIVKGTRLTKANMKEGNINFIGSSAINNGVTNYILNSERVHPANLITVSYNGSIGEAFYQNEPFWASDDVNVFYPKFEQNFEIAMFLIPLIRKVGEKYKFVDKWKLEDMCNDKIKLPVNENSEPDWKYMENYMKNIVEICNLNLDNLSLSV